MLSEGGPISGGWWWWCCGVKEHRIVCVCVCFVLVFFFLILLKNSIETSFRFYWSTLVVKHGQDPFNSLAT